MLAFLALPALLLLTTSDAFVVTTTSRTPPGAVRGGATDGPPKTTGATRLYGFGSDIKGVFDFLKNPTSDEDKESIEPKFETVVIDPDFRVAALFLVLGGVLDTIPYIQLTLGPLVTLLGVLFLVQTFRIRFVFDETSIELATVGGEEGELKTSGENIVVGGANRWDTKTIVNYDFFPKGWIDSNPIGPILVYFKETQTPSDKWNEGPGKSANDPDKIASGEAVAGQVHFFPAVCNAKQIRDEFDRRGCRKI